MEAYHYVKFDVKAIETAISMSDIYNHAEKQPSKSLKLLDLAATNLKAKLLLTDEKISSEGTLEPQIINGEMIEEASMIAYRLKKKKSFDVNQDTLTNLEEIIKKRVMGQDKAIDVVSKSIKKAKAGLRNPRRPIGVFLLVGMSGTGKTELAKALCQALYNSEDNLVRIDMSEYKEPHSISRMIGSPTGYVGADKGGFLTNALLQDTNRVVLFDEVEKAHDSIFDIFLQIFDDGRLTDGRGFTADFSQSIILLTSNLGVREAVQDGNRVGFGDSEEKNNSEDTITNVIRKTLRPEIYNRIQEVVYFKPLEKESLSKIAKKFVEKTNENLTEKGITIELDEALIDELVEKYNSSEGVRGIEKHYSKVVEDYLTNWILEGRFSQGTVVRILNKDGITNFEILEQKPVDVSV
jgi:ATP-dependent Clp protease ATP-binding subunit ClpC